MEPWAINFLYLVHPSYSKWQNVLLKANKWGWTHLYTVCPSIHPSIETVFSSRLLCMRLAGFLFRILSPTPSSSPRLLRRCTSLFQFWVNTNTVSYNSYTSFQSLQQEARVSFSPPPSLDLLTEVFRKVSVITSSVVYFLIGWGHSFYESIRVFALFGWASSCLGLCRSPLLLTSQM